MPVVNYIPTKQYANYSKIVFCYVSIRKKSYKSRAILIIFKLNSNLFVNNKQKCREFRENYTHPLACSQTTL